MKEERERQRKEAQRGEDTIAAVATAYGEGGIGIVRISGEKAADILTKIFLPHSSDEEKKEVDRGYFEDRKLRYGYIADERTGKKIDEVMAVYMRGPATYTCEDVVEIDCHGSVVSLRKILDLVLDQGARLAEKGEFTKRAFLNGRLDLAQAEAVTDLVAAKTNMGQAAALDQLEGQLSKRLRETRQQLLDILVNIGVNIDYPDEDIEPIVYKDLQEELRKIDKDIHELLESADTGRIVREGLQVAIVGKPNAGKSSLLNALLGENRAIVSEIPGTTRDAITEHISIADIPVNIMDTAGIREAQDEIEKLGIAKSEEGIDKADLVFFVLDGSKELEEEDKKIAENLKEKKLIALINKKDLEAKLDETTLLQLLPEARIIKTSLLDKTEGIGEIETVVQDMVFQGKVAQEESLMVSNARQEHLLREASKSLGDAINMLKAQEALELIEIDVKGAYESLGEILGENLKDDIIDEIFARFCLGK